MSTRTNRLGKRSLKKKKKEPGKKHFEYLSQFKASPKGLGLGGKDEMKKDQSEILSKGNKKKKGFTRRWPKFAWGFSSERKIAGTLTGRQKKGGK